MMTRETEEKLAKALTAETVELIPFLPYLLQDLWELGSNPRDILQLINKNITISDDFTFLELACGKGACSVNIAKALNVKVYGYDLLPDFIAYAKQKAKEWAVEELCHFAVGDVNELVNTESDYDCVIFSAVGDVLGDPEETLRKLSNTIKSGGYIIMDATYLPDDKNSRDLRWAYDYLKRDDWLHIFSDLGLTLVEELPETEEYDYESELKTMSVRVNELIAKHPDKRAMFERYLQNQKDEVADLENDLIGGMWLIQKI